MPSLPPRIILTRTSLGLGLVLAGSGVRGYFGSGSGSGSSVSVTLSACCCCCSRWDLFVCLFVSLLFHITLFEVTYFKVTGVAHLHLRSFGDSDLAATPASNNLQEDTHVLQQP